MKFQALVFVASLLAAATSTSTAAPMAPGGYNNNAASYYGADPYDSSDLESNTPLVDAQPMSPEQFFQQQQQQQQQQQTDSEDSDLAAELAALDNERAALARRQQEIEARMGRGQQYAAQQQEYTPEQQEYPPPATALYPQFEPSAPPFPVAQPPVFGAPPMYAPPMQYAPAPQYAPEPHPQYAPAPPQYAPEPQMPPQDPYAAYTVMPPAYDDQFHNTETYEDPRTSGKRRPGLRGSVRRNTKEMRRGFAYLPNVVGHGVKVTAREFGSGFNGAMRWTGRTLNSFAGGVRDAFAKDDYIYEDLPERMDGPGVPPPPPPTVPYDMANVVPTQPMRFREVPQPPRDQFMAA